ncbi:MAG: TraX family protein [Candidatus Pacebacteria bacterium]|nr:TraX family protein [Candidatus Paceibacterota bacterium]
MLRLIGAILMLIDHVGYVFFPDLAAFRLVGRLSFPLFAYQTTISFKKTSNFQNYLARLGFWAVIAEIPFILVFKTGLNILFTFFIGVIALKLFDSTNNKFLRGFYVVSFALLAFFLRTDYGAYGMLLLFVFYIFSREKVYNFVSQVFLSYIVAVAYSFPVQIASPFSFFIIYSKAGEKRLNLGKYFFYIFYPLHLLIIYFIAIYLFK